jgi:DNA invertase Pin-like site-specific DNA recombinase
MAIIGYARVSSRDQNLDRQTDALKAAGVEKIFSDKLSGKNTDRPGLKSALGYIREGDTLVVLSFDRMARSLPDLLRIVQEVTDKKVQFKSLHEQIDTSSPAGKFQLAIFGAMAEFERSMIAERRTEGIQAALDRGKRLGRPKIQKPTAWEKEVKAWEAGNQTAVQTWKNLKLSKSVFYALYRGDKP